MNDVVSEKTNGIPEIKFLKKRSAGIGFEIMPLDRLYKRHREGRIGFDIQRFYRPGFNQIILIERGRGRHFVDFCEYSYEPGDLIIVARKQVQAFDAVEPERGWLVLFTPEFLVKNMIHHEVHPINNLFGSIPGPPILKEQGNLESVKMLFRVLNDEYKETGNEHQYEILRHLLVALVLKLNTLRGKEHGRITNSGWLNLLNRLDEAMETDSFRFRDARRYAGRLGCSYKHLNTVCKSLTGQTAKHYIDQVLALEIKRCLAATALSIKELCWRFGFEEETNFVKFFKRHAGMSPKRFRDLQLR